MQLNLSEAHKIFGDFGEIHHSHLPPGVYDQVNEYKSRFASKFKSTHITNLASMQGNTYYASLKLDGEHAHLWWDDQYETPMLIRHRGYAYFGLPILQKAAAILKKKGIKKALIPGELYVRKPDYERTRVFDVISLTKAPKSQADLEMLSFAPFDILELDGQYFDDFGEVWQAILDLFQGTEIEPPPMLITKDKTEILTYFERWVNEYNAEGLMVRSDLTFRYKLKAKFTIDAAILGYTEDQGKVTSLLTGLMHNDGQYQVCAHVYKRIPDDLAVSLYKQLSKRHVPSEYYEMSSFYVPFHMVKPETVIEFSTTDMVPERSNGMPVKKAVLDYEKKEGYTLTKSSPFANLAHCEFVRIREDKAPNPQAIRLEQVTDIVYIDLNHDVQAISFPAPTILKREVFGKEMKGKMAVRKFIAYRSNKESVDTNYLPFVFNYTDFSPNRKDPLQQEMRISASESQILAIYNRFKEENVKTGWKEIESPK